MTSSPSWRTPVDAATRIGTWAPALPNDTGLDRLLADPRLGSTAKAIATVLVRNWAWYKPSCWPSDRTIARKVGKSPGHVQRCLRQLELTGWIHREQTDEVRSRRRIWLLWRCSNGREGARPGQSQAPTTATARARNKQVVVVTREVEQEVQPASRPRPETAPTSAAVPVTTASPMPILPGEEPTTSPIPPAEPITSPMPLPGPQNPHRTFSRSGMVEQTSPALPSLLRAPGERSGAPVPSPAPADPVGAVVTLELGAIGRPASSGSVPAAVPIPRNDARARPISPPSPTPDGGSRRKRPGLGLSLAELIRVAGETADPILAAEVARRTAPPAPPEPPAQSLPTPELFAQLPGRHDLIAAATRRLVEETGDYQSASWSFFGKAAEAVARRTVAPEVLLDCRRQALGPKARSAGKVFVTAWRREVSMRC